MSTPRRFPTPRMETSTLHDDLREATAELRSAAEAMKSLSGALQPLAEHVPALIMMANAWKAGEAVGRTAGLMTRILRWAAGVGISIAVIWALVHHKFLAILGNQP